MVNRFKKPDLFLYKLFKKYHSPFKTLSLTPSEQKSVLEVLGEIDFLAIFLRIRLERQF